MEPWTDGVRARRDMTHTRDVMGDGTVDAFRRVPVDRAVAEGYRWSKP